MKTRTTPRVIPDKGRYWSMDIQGTKHRFRFPYIAHAFSLVNMARSAAEQELVEDNATRAMGLLPVVGAMLGVCWYHETLDIEATWDKKADRLTAFGEAVIDELQEEDYDILGLLSITQEFAAELGKRLRPAAEAAEVADFTEARKGD